MVVATITMGGVFYAYLWDMTGTVWPVAMAHAAVNFMFGLGASAVVASSQDDLAYVAGESGLATFAVVAVAAVAVPGPGQGVAHRQRCGGRGRAGVGAGRLTKVLWPVDPAVLSCC